MFFETFGYFATTIVGAILTLLVFKTKKIKAYLMVTAAIVAIYFVFTYLLFVTLP